jgi:hypothetical protein
VVIAGHTNHTQRQPHVPTQKLATCQGTIQTDFEVLQMSTTTSPSRLALGCDWNGWVASNVSLYQWRRQYAWATLGPDPFHGGTRRNRLYGAVTALTPKAPTCWWAWPKAKHFRGEHVSQSAQEEMLGTIQADKAHCQKLIDTIIERMWIELGNCCGLRVQGGNGVQRPLASPNDLRQALKAVTPPAKLHMLLHFLFNYVRDALYPATLMMTHQWAVEQATLVQFALWRTPRESSNPRRVWQSCMVRSITIGNSDWPRLSSSRGMRWWWSIRTFPNLDRGSATNTPSSCTAGASPGTRRRQPR